MTSEFAIAVHALVYLTHKKEAQNSEQLAENICTNPARIRKVMAMLKKVGYVETKEGLHGGYHLAMPASKIKLSDVSDAVDEVFIKASWQSGNKDMDCMVASGMADVMEDMYAQMNDLCHNYLAKTTIASVERKLYKK